MRRFDQFLLNLERAIYRFVVVPLIAYLPTPLAYRLACWRADLRYRIDVAKREEIMRNLECFLGRELNAAQRARATRDFFRRQSCAQIDVMRLVGKGRRLARLVEIRGLEHLEAALAAGKGAILASAHFGSFQSSFSLIGSYGFPVTVIGRLDTRNQSRIHRRISWLIHGRLLARHLKRPNIEPWEGELGAAIQAASILRQNEVVATFLDPGPLGANRERAVPVDFLNGRALLLPGATIIAQLTEAPMLMTFMHRSKDWQHQVLTISPPMPLDGDAVTALRRCMAVIEETIRQDPGHWVLWGTRDLVTLGLLPEEALADDPLRTSESSSAS